PAVDLDRVRLDIRCRHNVRDDLALGLEQALVKSPFELVEFASAGLAFHRVVFQELSDPVNHAVVEGLAGFGCAHEARDVGTQAGRRRRTNGRRVGHAPINTRDPNGFPASITSGSDLHRALYPEMLSWSAR